MSTTRTPKIPLMRIWNDQEHKARFHNSGCRDGFRVDKGLGMIYGGAIVGGVRMEWCDASVAANFCAYCGPQAR